MLKIQKLGKIDISILEKEFGKLQTDEIIITYERITHIKEHHPQDYELFAEYGREVICSPDIIIRDGKNVGTIFLIKKLGKTNLNIIIRVALQTDDGKLKNSVMTFYRIRNKNLKKLIQKNSVLYKKK